ncbi:MAG: M16 family metallopeptidase [Candidatus Entotheonellia bacterium]
MKRRPYSSLATSLAVCLVIGCNLSWGQEAFHLNIKEFRLDNGLEVLILEDHAVPLVTVQVWYRVGSRNERPGITGISHFLEHMMFKGTPKYGPGIYSQLLQRYGGTQNAFTSYDMTAYYSVLPAARLELALDLEADRMTNLLLDPNEIKAEREVVKEERRLRENAPTGPMYEELGALAFKAHSYHWPIIGWMSDIEAISREDLLAHYKSYYVPNNATVIIVGDVDTGQTMEAVRRHFDPIPSGPTPPPVRPPEPPQLGEHRAEIPRPTALAAIAIAYHIPAFDHADALPLEVLSQILSQGQSSRLYRELVYQRQLASSINTDADLRIDPSLFTIVSMLQAGKSPAEVEAALYEQLDQVTAESIADRELQKAINQALSAFVFRQDSIQQQGFTIGSFHTLQSYKVINEYIERLRRVTKEDVARVARLYLTKTNRTVVTIVPMSPPKAG